MTGFPAPRAALAVAALVSVAGCAAPFVGTGDVPRTGTAQRRILSGDYMQIGPYVTVNENCSLKAPAKIIVTERPTAGAVSVFRARGEAGTFSGRYARCDDRIYNGATIRYTAPSGFVGRDRFAFRIIFVNGEVRDIAYDLDVVSSR